jgi:tRNA threonylcarbamoyl adenosine modification protein (Sua5/YciO/YrdC/YwlC family)
VFRKKKTVGIRIPDNAIIQQITEMLGNPVVSTSIKKDDDILEYPTNPELIWEEWQHQVDVVIDGGMGEIEPTTVIDLTSGDPVLVREGKGGLKV